MTGPGRPPLDEPAAVRSGEEVDANALRAWLAAHGVATAGPLHVTQFPRGFSNLTYLVRADEGEWVLRRPPFGVGPGSAHDVLREARLLALLAPVYAFAPKVRVICEDPTIIGAPFYLMERVRGIILRDRAPAGVDLTPDLLQRLSTRFVDVLADLHLLDVAQMGPAGIGRPDGYVHRQVEGWTRRYRAAQTHDHEGVDAAASWLATRIPEAVVPALVHNDFKYDNLVLDPADPSRILAVLDWEMATVGDPWLDLGTSLAYWVNADDPAELRALGLGITALPGNLTRAQLVDRYVQRTGRTPHDILFGYVFGLFKVAVIAQQIYARYVRGHTRDARFAQLHVAVAALGRAAERAIGTGAL
ncbi:MAG: phosphotransferase family protein [Gemmatimonadaceae bacterium]